jgi:anti-sigma B factor antagonist
MNFHIEESELSDGAQLIALGGEVDLYTAPQVRERLDAAIETGTTRLVVDLSKVTFIDSTTLGVLVGGTKRLRPSGGRIAVVCDEPAITRIFEITGLDGAFDILPTRDEAVAALAARAT